MEYIKSSYVYRIISSFIVILENAIKNSGIYKWLTKDVNNEEMLNKSIFVKLIYGVFNLIRKIFNWLKLDRVFKDSIFTKTNLFVYLAIVLAPFMPTMVMVGVIWVSILSFVLKICLTPDFKFRYAPTNFWILGFFIIYCFSAISSLAVMSSIKIAAVVGTFMLFYFVVINSIDEEKEINICMYLFVIAGLFVSLYGIYQTLSTTTFATAWVDKDLFEGLTMRVYSTFENPNVLGEYLLLVIPLSVSMFFASKGWIKKVLTFVMTCIMMVCLALTYSRGCYLGILFAAAVFVILLSIKFIVLLIAGVIALPFVLPDSIVTRFKSIGNMEDTSTTYRLSIWISSIELIREYWYRPIGQGAETFNKVYPLFAQREVGTQHAHNFFLQTTIETGLLGIIFMVIFIFKVFQYLFNGIKNVVRFEDKAYLIGFVSGLSGFMIQSVFDNTWYNYRVVLIFWMFISMAIRKKQIAVEGVKLLDDKNNAHN